MEDFEARLRRLAETDPDQLEAALQALRGHLFVPHANQVPIIESDARFRYVAAGRRFGKTKVAAKEVVREARQVKKGKKKMIWWVANTYKNVRRGYREVVAQTPPELLAKPAPVYTSNDLILHYKSGTIVEFYSGGNPEALAGEGVDFMVVDEGGLIEDRVWNQLLRPTLMDTGGRALCISTPRGHNWFWKGWVRGQEHKQNHESWQFSQRDNPYIPEEETDAAKEELPQIFYEQEILAEFIAGGQSIFSVGLQKEGAILDGLVEPVGQIYCGVDLADKEDFTVISACRAHDHLPVLHERFNQLGWSNQKLQIADAVTELQAYPAVESVTVMIDSTGVGDVVVEELEMMGIDIIAKKFTNEWKEKAVKLLAADMEHNRAFILEDQKPEFEGYEFKLTPSGNLKFEAAMGHDDEVSAKLLEHWALRHEGPPEISTVEASHEEAYVEDKSIDPGETGLPPDSPAEIMLRDEVWI